MEYDEKLIIKNLKVDARAVGISPGASDIFIKNIQKNLKKTLKSSKPTTQKEFNRILIKEIKKYSADLAYVYENRDKII